VDPESLRVPGATVFAVNTAYPHIRPDVWVGMDLPECYDGDLYWQPFVTITGTKYRDTEFGGRPIREAPNTYFASARELHDQDRPWMMFEPERLGDNPDFVWVGVTFYTALHVAIWMGCTTIYLVGADFGGSADYHDGRVLEEYLRKSNAYLMDRQVRDLPLLRMNAERIGVKIYSTSEHSRANEALDYVPLSKAIERTRASVPDSTGHERLHAYLAANSHWSDRTVAPQGVVTGADQKTEWMLAWWLDRLRKHNPGIPVAFADFGMSPGARGWCAERGEVLDVGAKTRLKGWMNKPTAICWAPFDRVVWLDTDCEVRGDLSPLFDMGGFRMVRDGYNRFDTTPEAYNTGVVACDHGEPAIVDWARRILRDAMAYRGDQECFNAMVAEGDIEAPEELPARFNRLRMAGEPPADSAVVHWTGPDGKERIRRAAAPQTVNYRGEQVVSWVRPLGNRLLGVEVGVLTGRFTRHLLERMPDVHMLMVDRWEKPAADSDYANSGDELAVRSQERFDDDYFRARKATDFASNRRSIWRMESTAAAAELPDGRIDFVFLDGDHSAAGVAADLAAWAPKVRDGGMICGHDIDHPRFPGFGVRGAVETYLNENCPGAELRLGDDFTWCFRVERKSLSRRAG